MKIQSVHLNSFRSAQHLTLPTDAPLVLICGRNHAGKSSVKEAIRWALLNRASVTDARGVGAEKLIPTGAQAASVTLQIEGVGGINRSFGPGAKSFTVEGMTGDAAVQQQALFDVLQTTPAFLDAVLDTGRFLGLHHIDAKALVLELLDIRVDVDGVSRTLDEIDTLYKQAFDDRKTAKSRLKSFAVKPLPTSPMPNGSQPPTVEAITAQLAKLRGLLEAATGTAGQTAGKRQVLTAQLAQAQQFVPFTDPLSRDEAQSKAQGLEAAIAAMDAAVAAVVPTPTAPNATFYRQAIDALVTHNPKNGCVLARDVPCETAKAKFTAVAKTFQAELDKLDVPAEADNPAVNGLAVARKQLQALRVLIAKYDQSAVFERSHADTVARLTAELAALPETAANEAEIAGLRLRIQNGETLLASARAYWASLYAHQESLKEQEGLTQAVDALEARCELLGPKGVRVAALAESFGRFETAINAALAPYGWTLAFSAEPWGMAVNGRPVETYSESEQYLIGMAIQLAIAALSGVSFAVVDRLDVLDVGHRTIATKILRECPLDQVIVLSTREPESAIKPQPGMIAHRLKSVDGMTQLQETVA